MVQMTVLCKIPKRLLTGKGVSFVGAPLFALLLSHLLLAYNSGLMARALAVILDNKVSFGMEAMH